MTMGEKILNMRKARGWSQEELAERIGVTRQAVSRWESGAAKPDADKLIAAKIPVSLVCGDSDGIVPYLENGKILSDKLKAAGTPFFEVLKNGCDHHPHGLEDNTPLIEFIKKYY